MRKNIAFLLLCIILVTVYTSFSYADASDLRWGMSKDTVILLMGKPTGTLTLGKEYDALGYDDQPISAYKGPLLLLLRNNCLMARIHSIDDNDGEKYQYLCNALDNKYGKSIDNLSDIAEAVILLMRLSGETDVEIGENEMKDKCKQAVDTGNFKSWKARKDTNIIIISIEGMACLLFMQPLEQTPEYNYDGL